MGKDIIHVTMLGNFSIEYKGKRLESSDNRARSSQLLLAYMICHRDRSISQAELFSVLWGDGEVPSNPQSAIKTLLHRTRAILNTLGEGAGYNIVICKGGCYAWNSAIETVCDFEEFASLCSDGYECDKPAKCLELFTAALELYGGDFLPKLSSERWVVPISTYYHKLFVNTTVKAAELLEKQGELGVVISMCRKALAIEPRSDKLMSHLLYALMNTGDREGVISQYESMSALLSQKYDSAPGQEMTELYNTAKNRFVGRTIPTEEIKEQLKEQSMATGPLKCSYEMFKVLYHAKSRAANRSKDVCHIVLFTVSAGTYLDSAMRQFGDIFQHNLRAGDVISRCSIAQYIIMLPGADGPSSRSVCERLAGYYDKQYPDSDVRLSYDIWQLEPIDGRSGRKRRLPKV